MTDSKRFDRHLTAWVNAIRSAPSTTFAEGLLECFARTATEEWPVELTDIEQLSDWTHEGLVAAAMAPKAPPGCAPESTPAYDAAAAYTSSVLLTLRMNQLVGRLAMACEQALHLGDQQTAIQMLRLMTREWRRLRGEAALDEAMRELGGALDQA